MRCARVKQPLPRYHQDAIRFACRVLLHRAGKVLPQSPPAESPPHQAAADGDAAAANFESVFSNRWTRTASLLTSVIKNLGSITTVLFKAKQRVIEMDFPPSLFDSIMENDDWDNVAQWEPVLRTLLAVTNYVQADTTPLSGVHACFLSLEASLVLFNFPLSIRDEIRGVIKLRYATIFSPAHVLSFCLDPVFLPFREMSRASTVKPYTMTGAEVCMEAAKRLMRTAS